MWSFWTLSLLTRGGYLLIGSAGVGKEICGSKTFFNNTFLLVMCTFSLKYWTEQLVLSHVSVLKENYICNVHLIFSTHLYVTASGGVLLSGTGKYIISGRIDINGWLSWKLMMDTLQIAHVQTLSHSTWVDHFIHLDGKWVMFNL